jgi:tetratricopeptide (TPR) repeat protein
MGCSLTKDLPSVIVPTIEKCEPVTIPTDVSNLHRETRRLENCIIVWLSTLSSIPEQKRMTKQLRCIVGMLKTFTDLDECVTFIQDIREEKVFLIVPSEMDTFIERFDHLPQLEMTYVFDTSSQGLKADNDCIVQPNIFRDIADLCEQLRQDVRLCELDLVAVTAVAADAPSTAFDSTSTKQTAFFLCTQLIKQIVLRMKFENEHRSEFVNFCRAHYRRDDEQLQAIDDFENNYRPQKVLWWLTNPCFVSRILHRVQRTQEIDVIYKMGFLIKHIHMQLAILHEKITSLRQNPVTVYRGKSMSSAEFDSLLRNNRGGLFMFSNFLTASTDKNVAVDFVRRRIATHPEMTGILFEVHIDPMIPNTTNPFALLNNLNSDIKSTKGEIYFTMGTVFRIESMEQVGNSPTTMWNVTLTLIDDNDQHFHGLVSPLRTSDVESSPLAYMGKLLIEMGECDRAVQFYLGVLNDPSVLNQPRRLVRVHNGLGTIFTHQGEYTRALEHYQISLKTGLSYLAPGHPDLAPIYHTIGGSYFNIGDYGQALYNYEQAAQLVEHSTQPPQKHFLDNLQSQIVKTRQILNIDT